MRFVDEYRDAELGRVLAGEILASVETGRHYKVMEVCGGHTHSIYKYGVDDLKDLAWNRQAHGLDPLDVLAAFGAAAVCRKR